jgi:hypothetical protein
MLKVAIPVALAVVILLGWLVFWAGRQVGRRQGSHAESRQQAAIDRGLHHDLVEFVNDLFTSTNDPDRFVMMPDHLKVRGQQLIDRNKQHQRRLAR